ncbi:MAG: hypothetical protein A2233_02115 [Candidatus Kerfeldbacteria bacterium RIFOXYA2_FULL_38_24]|uniref:DNA ligase n=1 Tax=Candidatus Kerfeldbacteria bacterium RIFOXYB2_FULL_38_14 TaxID=1798547 RepID=A0A1G2BHF4_9BACT|nr:MAG: hypothetical protein A2319_04715 [Candidatus Kerfeldbacteria bacterium RIFOXYB2_FULL_38_14]OGY87910.1 MAG: hypothetical protein A2233_02115 [Candidatus Kerfeldbacteria bacterium RIFOXYA2_FULL_38_24]OGY88675.1 MAG: hypothetical protein A2458_03490 [Candidatus Kerfeldbacteria bacterium RIFOXYC2_FULL_38_9]
MTKALAQKRIQKLKKEIDHYRYVYHVLDQPEISDAALDSLKKELFDLEQQYPDLVTSDSPTQRVGGKPLDKFTKVKHPTRMLSLNDAFSEEDLQDWQKRLHRLTENAQLDFFVEPKLDGLAISLIYENGLLKIGATRGNGLIGEEVTNNLITIESIPLRLREIPEATKVKTIEVRGEVYMTKKVFDKINRERQKAGEAIYMNPRNTAAGTIRQLDPAIVKSRELRFSAYALPTNLGQTTHQQEHILLKKLGFRTDPSATAAKNLQEVWSVYQNIQKKRDHLPYQIDGVVVVVNSNKQFARLGIVGKAPRASIALKFPAEQAVTVIEDIVVQIGRTGALTPVAHLKKVAVAGTTVARATLHNIDEIKRLNVKIGDTVIVEKAGDIIPDIIQVLPNLRTGKEKNFTMPKFCPSCGSKIIRHANEVAYYCPNHACFSQQKERFYHFVSKKAFNIEGLGPKIIDHLLTAGLLNTPADIFNLTENDLQSLERFAEKSASNLIIAIKKSRTISLPRLIFALGIRHVGEQTALTLAEKFLTFARIQNASAEELQNIHDVGIIASHSITAYFQQRKNQIYLAKLLPHLIVQKVKKTDTKKLAGKYFLFTGTLQAQTREDAKQSVRNNGGQVMSGVSKKLDYLVVGEKPGSKLLQAQKLGIKILNESEFLKLLN